MTTRQKSQLSFIGALIVFAIVVLLPTFVPEKTLPEWWPSRPIRLGLDLKGGTYLTLAVQTEEAVKSQLNSMASAIRADLRKEQVGVLKAQGNSTHGIEIILLNEKGVETVTGFIRREYPQLQFGGQVPEEGRVKLTYSLPEKDVTEMKRSAVEQAIETIRNRIDAFGVAEPTIQRSGEEQIVVQLPAITDLGSVRSTIGEVAKLEFRLVANSSTPESDRKTLRKKAARGEGGNVVVEDRVLMTGDVIEKAIVDVNSRTHDYEVSLKLNTVGAKLFEQITTENQGRQLAIILDGQSQSEPVIREPISGGRAQISGRFTPDDAHHLAIVLRSGALPAPLEFGQTRTVGASLGADSIKKGISATLFGAALVVVFMIIYYRKCGALAVFCLGVNIAILMAAMALMGATLTLPGIAGLGLTIGMAVDSNVIVFERIREELKLGASARAAIDAGFFKAHWTILDANLTTLLAGVLLYGYGTGPIKGFAVTLSLGVLTTVFTALVVSKLLFEVLAMKDRQGALSI